MKASKPFEKIISDYLESRGKSDSLFAETLKKSSKSIDQCINYIFSEVKKSGCNGFADEEIYAMAVHYYDEDDIEVGKPVQGKVVVNHSIPASQSTSPNEVKPTEPTKQSAPIKKAKPVITNQAALF